MGEWGTREGFSAGLRHGIRWLGPGERETKDRGGVGWQDKMRCARRPRGREGPVNTLGSWGRSEEELSAAKAYSQGERG